jgi:hypothetical protein
MQGVNFSNFIFDNNNLSTTRGGGMLLLNSTERVKQQFTELREVATGASTGVFEFEAPSDEAADKTKKAVEKFLNDDPGLKHATFVVDKLLANSEGKFNKDKERLIALNRWQQMQSPSIAVPSFSSDEVCSIDMVRPATCPGPEGKISESTYQRREYGKKKKEIIEGLTGLTLTHNFPRDFNELTSENTAKKSRLNNKMAVIYIDGNYFGKLQDDLCKTAKDQRAFDRLLKESRSQFLKNLFQNMESDSIGWLSSGGNYRIEILLWGGDELMLVVPAWKGWETLARFYSESKEWKFKGKHLKHASGIVFCHYNSPIHRIKELARELAEAAKKDRNRNIFNYEVLESFDHIGRSLKKYRQDRSPKGVNPDDAFILDGEKINDIADQIRIIKNNDFPTGKLHYIVKGLLSKNDDALEDVKKIITTMKDTLNSDISNALEQIRAFCGGPSARWLHLANLWDYIT